MNEETQDSKYVITQPANLPLVVAVASTVASFTVLLNRTVGEFFVLIAYGAWFTWAWLELFEGVNAFRKLLGGMVMAALLAVGLVALHVFIPKP